MESPRSSDRASPDAQRTQWFTEEVHRHELVLRSYLRGAFPAVRDVDDVVQESFLRIWHAATRQRIKSAKAFLFTIARRLALNQIRNERARPFVEVADLASLFVTDERVSAHDSAALAEEIDLLVQAIDSLPARCREIFILRRLHGVPQKQIAERLGLSEQTVQVQAARGLQRCAEFVRRKMKTP